MTNKATFTTPTGVVVSKDNWKTLTDSWASETAQRMEVIQALGLFALDTFRRGHGETYYLNDLYQKARSVRGVTLLTMCDWLQHATYGDCAVVGKGDDAKFCRTQKGKVKVRPLDTLKFWADFNDKGTVEPKPLELQAILKMLDTAISGKRGKKDVPVTEDATKYAKVMREAFNAEFKADTGELKADEIEAFRAYQAERKAIAKVAVAAVAAEVPVEAPVETVVTIDDELDAIDAAMAIA